MKTSIVDAINAAQAELDDAKEGLGDLVSDFHDIATPSGDLYVPLELGNIAFYGTGPVYSASTKRVRTVEGMTVKLKAGDVIGLSDYSNAQFWASWLPDGESTWSNNGSWKSTDFTVSVAGEYILIIHNTTEVAQESAEALGGLLVVRKNNSYHNDIVHELSVPPITHYEMPFSGYIGSDGTTIMPANEAKKERYTDYIPVQYGKKYVVDYRVKVNTTNFIAYSTYDSEKTPVLSRRGYDRGFVLGDDGYYQITFEPTIADSVAYIRITAQTYGDSFLTICEDDAYICTTIQPVLQKFRKERDEAINTIYQPDVYRPIYSPVMYDAVCKGINHRGAYRCPENTMIAYETSKADGFYFVETDVRLTSDNEFVLLHDGSINSVARNADGTTISETVNIADITLAEALTYDFGIARGQDFAGTKIATLAEFLAYCKRALLHPYIEVKFSDMSYIDALVDMVDSYGLRGRSTYITGNTTALKAIVTKDKMARVGYTASNPALTIMDTLETLKTGYNEVFINVETIRDGLIDACVAHKIPLELWTYSASQDAILAKPDYVTGITHNSYHAGKLIYESVVD